MPYTRGMTTCAKATGDSVGEAIISIIDDDEAVRSSLDSLMRSLGLRSAAFASAEEFLRSALSSRPGCVISDVDLPGGMNGFELGTKLAAVSRQPLILISGRSDKDYEARAQNVGAICFLRKPFSAETLIARLATVITI